MDPSSSRTEKLLAFDLALCAGFDGQDLEELRLDDPVIATTPSENDFPMAGRGATPRSALRLVGFDEAGRGATPRSALRLVGFDEAGRGALAGPVAVGCVHIDLRPAADPLFSHTFLEAFEGLDDSKRLTPRRREAAFERIVERAGWAVGYASAAEIDRVGIVVACRLAARRAYERLGVCPDVLLFDRGLSLADRSAPVEGSRRIELTRGDARSLHVAAASIVAKVSRDRVMAHLDGRFEGYGLARHKGYGTSAHREAIGRLGRSRIHRGTFLGEPQMTESQFC